VPEQTAVRRREVTKVWLFVLLLPLIFYALNAGRLLIPYWINHAKWDRQQIDSYEIVIDYVAYAPTSGNNRLVISDGVLVEAEHCFPEFESSGICAEPYPSSRVIDSSHEDLTIDGLFRQIKRCITGFLLYTCSFQYNAQYGYPEMASIGSRRHAHGSDYMEVLNFEPLDSPIDKSSAGCPPTLFVSPVYALSVNNICNSAPRQQPAD
jgi:hypothetical protein